MRLLVLYGSYRRDRKGIRLADYTVEEFKARGNDVESSVKNSGAV
jgi:NAD(P)H-dependent FMN reductase